MPVLAIVLLLLIIAILVAIYFVFASFAWGAGYQPAPGRVVRRMLELGEVGPSDRVIDLGAGTGAIIFRAARERGATAIGVELEPIRIKLPDHPFVGALRAGVEPRVASPEIARVLAIPLRPLIDGTQPIGAIEGEFDGARIFAPHFDLDGCVLYGASAYVLYELLLRLAAALGSKLPAPRLQDEPPWGDRYRSGRQ